MLIGKGFAFWNTIPTRLRSILTSTLLPYMFSPSYLISPSILTPGTRSFIRFKVLRKVDLPHPEGPIRAVILFAGTSILMSLSACFSLYQRLSPLTSIFLSVISSLLFFILFSAPSLLHASCRNFRAEVDYKRQNHKDECYRKRDVRLPALSGIDIESYRQRDR